MKVHSLLFWLTLVLLPTQLGYHFWPSWAFVLGRRVDYLAPTLFLTDICIFATLVSWLWEQHSTIVRISRTRAVFAGFICLYIGMNIAVSQQIAVTLYSWLKFIEFVLFGIYIIRTKPTHRFIATALSGAIMYSSILAIAQWVTQRSVGGMFWFLGERSFSINTPGVARMDLCGFFAHGCTLILRSYATFSHPNVLAGFLVTGLLYVYFIYVQENQIKLRTWFAFVLTLGAIALLCTFSRSAVFAACIVGIALYVRRYVSRSNMSDSYTHMVKHMTRVVILGLLLVSAIYFTRQIALTEESVTVRQELIASSLRMIAHSPLLGVGAGNFLIALPHFMTTRSVYFLQPVHNIYLLMVSEIGFIGVIMLFVFLMQQMRNVQLRTAQALSLGLLLVIGLIDHYPLTLQQGQLMFVLYFSLIF